MIMISCPLNGAPDLGAQWADPAVPLNFLNLAGLANAPSLGNDPFLFQLGAHLGLHLPAYALKGELLEATERLPPVLARLVLRDALEEIGRPHAHLFILVEQAERDVKEPGVRLGRDGKQKADLVVRVDMLGEGDVDVLALQGRKTLRSEAVVHMVEVEALEGPDGVELCEVLDG